MRIKSPIKDAWQAETPEAPGADQETNGDSTQMYVGATSCQQQMIFLIITSGGRLSFLFFFFNLKMASEASKK